MLCLLWSAKGALLFPTSGARYGHMGSSWASAGTRASNTWDWGRAVATGSSGLLLGRAEYSTKSSCPAEGTCLIGALSPE